MIKEKRIAFIIEGEQYEKSIINSIKHNFFVKNDKALYTIIQLPMATNLYVLWKEVNKDKYLDIIELVRECAPQAKEKLKGLTRESFSEVYLFFDYDSHQKNLKSDENANEVLLQMLETFDNETENGKLYISYPMAEAIRDAIAGQCHTYSGKCYYMQIDRQYKTLSGDNNPLSHIGSYTKNKWADLINVYRGRLSCLYNKGSLMSIRDCKNVSSIEIYKKQHGNEIENGLGEEVLSAFPQFLIDYFKEAYLDTIISQRQFDCPFCNDDEKKREVSKN